MILLFLTADNATDCQGFRGGGERSDYFEQSPHPYLSTHTSSAVAGSFAVYWLLSLRNIHVESFALLEVKSTSMNLLILFIFRISLIFASFVDPNEAYIIVETWAQTSYGRISMEAYQRRFGSDRFGSYSGYVYTAIGIAGRRCDSFKH